MEDPLKLPPPPEQPRLPDHTPSSTFVEPLAVPLAPQSDLALRMLYEEQTRLRAELDKLRDEKQEGGKEGDQKEGGEGGGDKGEKDDKGQKEKENKPPLKKRMSDWTHHHPVATVLIIAGCILLIIIGVLLFRYLSSFTNTDDAFVDGHTDPMSFRVAGRVRAIYVEDTYRVKKGQLLAELDPRDNQIAKEQSAASYAEAKAATGAQEPNVPITSVNQSTQVAEAQNNVRSYEAQVAAAEERFHSAEADLVQAEANEANAAREEERYRALVVKEEVSREQYDQRVTTHQADAAVVASRKQTAEAAGKTVQQMQAALSTAQQQLKQAINNQPRQIAIQRATLAQRHANELAAKAQADQSELNLEYTRLYAPEDGVIGNKQAQVDTEVTAGQELFALTQTNDIWVTANFKETQIKKMWPHQRVTIYVDALGLNFDGYVEALPGASGAVYSLLPPENATGNYVKVVQRLPVRIRINPGQPDASRLAPGMSVEPKVWFR
jgi:membrane fusion protein, multidrug efflux system